MDRQIVYAGAIPLDTDLLSAERNALVALGFLARATIGTGPVFDGLACTPVTGQLAVSVGPGSGAAILPLDPNGFGSLPAGNASLVAVGCNLQPVELILGAPSAAGTSQVWLIEACVTEQDTATIVLPYWNAANPAVPYAGPNGSGTAQPTQRVQRVSLTAKAGAPAITGQQTAPSSDPGWFGLYTVSIDAGSTQIVPNQIVPLSTAPFLSFKLPQLRPGFPSRSIFTASGSFGVPAGVTNLRVRVIGGGGGGAGSTSSGLGGGGGGAGGYAEGIVAVQPGQVIPVTVGAGGAGVSGGSAAWGGTSSFGSFMSATGGAGGTSIGIGGLGGSSFGGDMNALGGCGMDGYANGLVFPAVGGAGAFGGGGRGSNGPAQAINGQAFGSGGGGAYLTPGSGGNGAAGIVIVEY
jgi:hypothetical protein